MIQEFLRHQAINKGLADATIEGYRKDLKAFVLYAQTRGWRWSTISQADLETYVRDERARGMKPRTIKRRIEVLRCLYKWAQQKGMVDYNPAWFVETPKVPDELPKATPAEMIDGYLAKPITNRQSLIVHMITAIIADTGIRISEVLQLTGSDFQQRDHEVRIKGKGNKERIVYYGKRVEPYLGILTSQPGRIFRQTDMEYRYMMIDEQPGMHPHGIRHAFACERLNNGMRLTTLSALMGHKHTSTTQIYARLTSSTMRNEYLQTAGANAPA